MSEDNSDGAAAVEDLPSQTVEEETPDDTQNEDVLPIIDVPDGKLPIVDAVEQELDSMPAKRVAKEPEAPIPTDGRGSVEVIYKIKGQDPKQTTWPGQQGPAAVAPEGVQLNKPQQQCAEFLDELRKKANSGFEVQVVRRRPSMFRNYILEVSKVISQFRPMAFADLYDAVKSRHGGGDYSLTVLNRNRDVVHNMDFTIDEMIVDPVVPRGAATVETVDMHPEAREELTAPGQGTYRQPSYQPGQTSRMPNPIMPAAVSAGSQELLDSRTSHRKLVAQREEMLARHELLKLERKIQEEDEEYRKRREKRLEGPQDEAKKEIDAVRGEMAKAIESMQGMVKDALTVNQKEDQTLPFMLKSMETSSAMQMKGMENTVALITAMMAANNTGSKSNESMEMFKLLSESSRTSMDNLIKVHLAPPKKDENASEFRYIVKAMLHKQLNASDNTNIKQAMDMWERGKATTLELVEARENREENPPFFGEDSGFWGNVGNIVVKGAQRLMEGVGSAAARPAGPMNPMTPMVTPPPTQQPVQMQAQLPPPQARQPTQRAQMPAQQPPQVQQPVEQPAQVRRHSPNVIPLDPEHFDSVVDEHGNVVEFAEAPVPVQQEAAPVQQPGPEVNDSPFLQEHVTEAMRIAIDDLDSERPEPDWIEYATSKWGNFIDVLARAPDDAARIQLLTERCDPEVYAMLHQRLSGGRGALGFSRGLNALLNSYLENSHGAIRPAVA